MRSTTRWASASASRGVGLTDAVYFGGKPIARYSAGQWTDLIYGPTGLLAEVPGTQNGAPVYRVTDHLGSTVGSLLADGSLVNPVDYTPFGQVFRSSALVVPSWSGASQRHAIRLACLVDDGSSAEPGGPQPVG